MSSRPVGAAQRVATAGVLVAVGLLALAGSGLTRSAEALPAQVRPALRALPLQAAGDGIRSLRIDGDQLLVTVDASALERPTNMGSGGVAVSLDGHAVPARVTTVSELPDSAASSATMLLIDTSGSMAGAGIAGAQAAAAAFLAQAPSWARVGLTSFSGEVHPLVAPTTDRGVVLAAVNGLAADGETALRDAVLSAIASLGADGGDRRIVLLSDGADTVSRSSLGEDVAQLKASGIRLVAVQYGPESEQNATLSALTATVGGSPTHAADTAAVAAAFASAATTFAQEVDITATLATTDRTRHGVLSLSLGVGPGRTVFSQDLATATFGRATTGRPVTGTPAPAIGAAAGRTAPGSAAVGASGFGSAASRPWAVAGVFTGLALLLLVVMGLGGSRSAGSRRTRRLLEGYGQRQQPAPVAAGPGEPSESPVARSVLEFADRIIKRRDVEGRLNLKLDQANLPLRANEWVLLRFLLFVTVGCLLFALMDSLLAVVALTVAVGVLLPRAVLGLRIKRRRKAFEEALPDALQLMASGLSTGYSLPQVLDTVVRQGNQPLAGEFGRALAEARIGVPVTDALDDIATRMVSEDFHWVVMAIRIQRDVGGNLGEVLRTVGNTMRERSRLRRQVRTLSAEGRLSAWILIGLPLALAAYEMAFRGEYFSPMYTTLIGQAMLGFCAVTLSLGALWMNKLVKVEV